MIDKGKLRDQVKAMLLLTAIGDALGMAVETMTASEIAERFGRVTDYIRPDGHKWFNGRGKGEWTDDWLFTDIIADSIVAKSGNIDIADIAWRHAAVYKSGELKYYGAGGTTRKALRNLSEGVHWSDSGIEGGAGNGVAMKVAPIGALLCSKIFTRRARIDAKLFDEVRWLNEWADEKTRDLARMTHKTKLGVASGCAQVNAICSCLMSAISEKENHDSMRRHFITSVRIAADYGERIMPDDGIEDKLSDIFAKLLLGPYRSMNTKDLLEFTGGATCYVYNSLPFSYAMFLKVPDKIETLYDVINAGGDTDTNGAIVGALLGAYNGTKIIPTHLLEGLWRRDEVETTIANFCDSLGL